MKNETLVKIAVVGFLGLVVIPAVVGGVIKIGAYTYAGIANGISKAKYNKKIKKGLEDGSIVEIDGNYYEALEIKGADVVFTTEEA